MPGRSAATSSCGCTSGTSSQPETVHSERLVVLGHLLPGQRHPQEAHHVARTRSNGLSNGIPFQRRTMTSEEEPMPSANRPGAASASAAALCAIVAGPRVNAGTMAVPSRNVGAQAAARASGVNASAPPTSADQTSV